MHVEVAQELLVRLLGGDLAGDDVWMVAHIISLVYGEYKRKSEIFLAVYAYIYDANYTQMCSTHDKYK